MWFNYHLRVFLTPYKINTVLCTNDKSLAIQCFKSIKRNKPKFKPYLIETFDPLQEEIDNMGIDFYIEFPEEGLIEGKYYKSIAINISTDWESGMADEWDIGIDETEITSEVENDTIRYIYRKSYCKNKCCDSNYRRWSIRKCKCRP